MYWFLSVLKSSFKAVISYTQELPCARHSSEISLTSKSPLLFFILHMRINGGTLLISTCAPVMRGLGWRSG